MTFEPVKGTLSATLTATLAAPLGRAAGNREVVQRLKGLLKKAREGHATGLFYVLVESQKNAGYGFAGTQGSLRPGEEGIEILLEELRKTRREMSEGPRLEKDFSYHEYNFLTDPINFDFLVWLVNAELIRRRNNAPWPLRVAFVGRELIPDRFRNLVNNVHRQLLRMIGGVEDEAAIGGHRAARFTPSDICAAARRGEAVPMLKADKEVLPKIENWLKQWGSDQKPVVITLREASHFPARNSNRAAFVKFAHELRSKGELVIFVRDTECANKPLEDFITLPSASTSLMIRMCLYSCAKCNLFTSNGPGGLGIFSDLPYLYFLNLNTDPNDPVNDPNWWTFANGITEGEQWPWAASNQQMIWGEDDYPTIATAWEKYYG